MPFRKKPRDFMNVRSKSNTNKSLPRTVHRWLPKMQPLAELVAKWIPKIVQICLWIIDSGCSKHMTGNRALLTNFVEKFPGTVRFCNNNFAVIAGYGDVVFLACEQGKIHRKHHKSKTAFASNKPLYLLHMDLCGPVYVESINGKRYVFEPGLSNLNETGKSSNPLVSQVLETSKKDLEDLFQNFYDEYFDSSKIMKSSTTNVETSNVEVPSNEEKFFSSESF
nr:integrase, catalytic region, zinc finger, CCHC-type, peptidase aspartic, catalytic [Tanacetum cinerariifolium]